MFILRNVRNGQVLFGNERKKYIVCRNRRAAEKAVREIRERTGVTLSYERVNRENTFGLWRLRREDGKIHCAAPGVALAFQSAKDAWDHSGSVFHETSKILIPALI